MPFPPPPNRRKGRVRIEYIQDKSVRAATKFKRRNTLIRKVGELSQLCGVRVIMVLLDDKPTTPPTMRITSVSPGVGDIRPLIRECVRVCTEEEEEEEEGEKEEEKRPPSPPPPPTHSHLLPLVTDPMISSITWTESSDESSG